MNILVSAFSCDPYSGGEAGNGWNFASKLSGSGHHVLCFTSTEAKENVYKGIKEQNVKNIEFVFIDLPKVYSTLYKFSIVGVYLFYVIWQKKALRIAKHKIEQEKVHIDIVHHITWGSLQLGSALWRLKKPFFFGPLGGGQFAPTIFKKYFYDFWKMEKIRSWVSWFFITFNPDTYKSIRKADLILTTNHETYDLAINNKAKNVELFLDTSLPEDFYPEFPKVQTDPSKTLKLLWVGRVFARKGLPLVLEALSRTPKNLNYELTILGDGPLGNKIEGWIKEYGLENKVDWRGRVTYDKVKEAYASHDVFLFCSLRDSSAFQFLEALAYGLPVITLNIHGARNLVPDNAGIKVQVNSLEQVLGDLSDAVVKLCNDPELRIEMSKNGYEYAKTQSWNNKITQILGFYEKYITR